MPAQLAQHPLRQHPWCPVPLAKNILLKLAAERGLDVQIMIFLSLIRTQVCAEKAPREILSSPPSLPWPSSARKWSVCDHDDDDDEDGADDDDENDDDDHGDDDDDHGSFPPSCPLRTSRKLLEKTSAQAEVG